MDTTEIDNLKTRYVRQISLPEVGEEGQMRLTEKRVAVIGAGGMGSALLPLLVGSGVGHLREEELALQGALKSHVEL